MPSEADYLSSLASIMTGKHTRVVIRGDGACIAKDGRTAVMVLPEDGSLDRYPLTDMLSDDEIRELNKHLDIETLTPEKLAQAKHSTEDVAKKLMRRMLCHHESAHGRYSPPGEVMKTMSQEVRMMYNLFEDRRIEASYASDFPPMYDKFYDLRHTLLTDTVVKVKGADVTALPDAAKLYLFAIASSMITTDFDVGEEYLNHPVVQAILDGIEQVETDIDNKDLPVQLAQDIVKMMKLKETPQPPRQPPQKRGKSKSPPGKGKGQCPPGPQDEPPEDEGDQPDDGNEGDQPEDEGEGDQPDDEPGISEDDLNNLEDEYDRLGISKEAGRDSTLNMKTASLIDQNTATRIAQVLKNIRGSRKSTREINSDDGYMMDLAEVMQMKASTNPVGFKPFIDSDKSNPEFDITLCIDHSGSMGGDPMENAKKAAATFCAACQKVKIDTCIIAFDGETTMVKPFDQQIEHSPLGNVGPAGGTDIANAMRDAVGGLEMRKRQTAGNRKQAMILVSDGEDYNFVGIADQMARAHANGVLPFFIGIGSGPKGLIDKLAQYCKFSQAVFVNDAATDLGKELKKLAEAFLRESQ